jgi:Ca-activated chloride channel family protein
VRARLTAVLLALVVLPAACSTSPSGTSSPSATLNVLAGSELKDLQPVLADFQRSTGYQVAMHYIGSLDGAERIVNGDSSDLAWFSSGRYLSLLQGSSHKVLAQQPIMLSPVVLGVKHSTALRLGWAGNPNVTWRDVADRSRAGDFRFAMTNPTASNSGFAALVGVAQAFSPTPDALQAGDINTAALKDFFTGQTLTAGSSGFLADSFVRQQDQLDGIVNYESVLLSMNAGGKLREPLDLVYPKEGIVTADYPLMLLRQSRRAIYDKLVAYLRQPDVQRRIMTTTGRRPTVPEVKPDSRFPNQVLIELPFPSSLDVVNKLLASYLNEIRHPSHTVFVLDTSGSMDGPRIDSLKHALLNLAGADTSISGRFAGFHNRESVTMVLFSSQPYDQRSFQLSDTGDNSGELQRIRTYVNGLHAGGGTAIYDALEVAYRISGDARASQPDDYYSIVLMTDGENNAGRDGSGFLSDYRGWPSSWRTIPTFPVLFGEGDPKQLQQIAGTTGGTVFDGRNADLSLIFKEIRGYQ